MINELLFYFPLNAIESFIERHQTVNENDIKWRVVFSILQMLTIFKERLKKIFYSEWSWGSRGHQQQMEPRTGGRCHIIYMDLCGGVCHFYKCAAVTVECWIFFFFFTCYSWIQALPLLTLSLCSRPFVGLLLHVTSAAEETAVAVSLSTAAEEAASCEPSTLVFHLRRRFLSVLEFRPSPRDVTAHVLMRSLLTEPTLKKKSTTH